MAYLALHCGTVTTGFDFSHERTNEQLSTRDDKNLLLVFLSFCIFFFCF